LLKYARMSIWNFLQILKFQCLKV